MRRAALLVILLTISGCVGQGNGAKDVDGDGLPDDQETEAHAITITFANGTVETRMVASDPHRQDTDGDSVTDVSEYALKTDPRSPDTDGDGLLDGHNATLDPASERAQAWRALGILETRPGSGVFVGEADAAGPCTLSPIRGSSDVPFPDKLSDGEELAGWNITLRGFSFHVTSDPCAPDTDRDGLPDDAEKRLGTDPRNSDTDGDGVPDGFDADPLWNLGIGVENVTTTGNGTVARVAFQVGNQATELFSNENRSATLDVNDSTPDRGTLTTIMLLSAHDFANARTLDFFGDPRGAYLTMDLAQGTTAVSNGPAKTTRHVELEGPDGKLSFDWRVARS